MGPEAEQYAKKSAFQAVYLAAFLLAILNTGSIVIGRSSEFSSKIAGVNTGNAKYVTWSFLLLLGICFLHWLRLYITLERLEDDLSSNTPTWFCGWKRTMRFIEFVARCAMIAWMALKAIDPKQLEDPAPFFYFLGFLYALMVFWGVVFIFGELTAGRWPNNRRAWWELAGVQSYLRLSVPGSAGLAFIAFLIKSSVNENFILLPIICVVISYFLGRDLYLDFVNTKDFGSNAVSIPNASWIESRRGGGYLKWAYIRVANDEALLAIFFSMSLWGIGTLIADPLQSFRALHSFSFIAAVIMVWSAGSSIFRTFTTAGLRRTFPLLVFVACAGVVVSAVAIFRNTGGIEVSKEVVMKSLEVSMKWREWLWRISILAFVTFLGEKVFLGRGLGKTEDGA